MRSPDELFESADEETDAAARHKGEKKLTNIFCSYKYCSHTWSYGRIGIDLGPYIVLFCRKA